jgi:16S rRNA (adenine1518-N6/adenine1519-N6)-dimethyltransferase
VAHIARKRFGQHFLHDESVIRAIVKAIAPKNGERLVEIGPGQAALTSAILDHIVHLDAIELDRDLVAWLRKKFSSDRLTVHEGDVLAFDFQSLFNTNTDEASTVISATKPKRLRLIGNLPYNISTPLMVKLIAFRDLLIDQHYMLQKEVVERICAQPDTAAYGRLTVLLQAFFDAQYLFDVGPESFDPPPKVDSAIIRLTPAAQPTQVAVPTLEGMLGAAFGQRRKMIRKTLLPWLQGQGMDISQGPAKDLDGMMRPENIPVATYLALGSALEVARSQIRA